MNNPGNERRKGIEVSPIDVIWGVLAQWKVALVFAVIISLLLTGAKYYKDNHDYKEAVKNAANIKQISKEPYSKSVDKILETLPESERLTVEFLVEQKAWIEEEKEYINKSIVMKMDPTNQRAIAMDYYIETENETNSVMASLGLGYYSFINDNKLINGIKNVIDPTLDNKYISELIYTPNSFGQNDDGDMIFEIRIVVPDGVDIKDIEDAVETAMTEYSKQLKERITEHTVTLIKTEEIRLYNSTAVSNRNNTMYSVYNLQNNTKNIEETLSDAQKTALKNIELLENADKANADSTENSLEIVKPSANILLAIIGFILGIIIYAFIYAFGVLIKGKITSADQLGYYTSSRVLGTFLYPKKYQGTELLWNSRIVDNLHYGKLISKGDQIGKIVKGIETICKSKRVDHVTFLTTTNCKESLDFISEIVSKIGEKGILGETIDVSEETGRLETVFAENAIYVADKNCKATLLLDISDIITEYKITHIGSIFVDRRGE